jgi:VanZ family protein
MKINTGHTIFKDYFKSFLSFLLILILCFLPGNSVNKVKFIDFLHFDKIVHFGMFFIFSFFLFADIKNKTQLQKKQIILIILSLTVIIGGLIELIQNFFIPNRFGDWFDFLADFSGSFAFILLSFFLKDKRFF